MESRELQDRRRFEAIRDYADKILALAADRYHTPASPLLADCLNPDGSQRETACNQVEGVVESNLARQMNFLRLLEGLSALSGDSKYEESAQAQMKYYFDHYQHPTGLMRWGGHVFVNLKTLEAIGPEEKHMVHELKNDFPYYDFMYKVNPEAAGRYIRAFWNAHVFNWKTLEISRHGEESTPMGQLWDNVFDPPAPIFEAKGLSFLNAGNDLMYSALSLYSHEGEEKALAWVKNMFQMYVKARHPKTGLGAYQFTKPEKRADTDDDTITLSWYGDRCSRQFGYLLGEDALEAWMLAGDRGPTIYGLNPIMLMNQMKKLGRDKLGDTLEALRTGLLAFAKYAYDPKTNQWKPINCGGTDLTDVVFEKNGYYGKKGSRFYRYFADGLFLLSYMTAALLTQDEGLFEMVDQIAAGNGLGDLGLRSGRPSVNLDTSCTCPYCLFALTALYRDTHKAEYLDLARAIGDNILRDKMQNGLFVTGRDNTVRINALEPLAVLTLDSVIQGRAGAVDGSIFF